MIIGITGRAGSGKSKAVELILKHHDFQVIDLDEIGHELLWDKEVVQEITAHFGKSVLGVDFHVIRPDLGKIVFSDRDKLDELNTIMHPRMKKIIEKRINKNSDKDYIILGALIKEIGLSSLCDKILTIDAVDEDIEKYAGTRKLNIAKIQRSREEYQFEADKIILNPFFEEPFERLCLEAVSELI